MIKDFLSIIYNNIVSTCYDTNKGNNDIININDNRELFKDYTSLYNDVKLTNLDLCLKDDSKNDLKDDSKNDLKDDLKDDSKNDLKDDSKNDKKDDLKDDSKNDLKDDLKDDSKNDLSSCCSDVYDKVDDFLD